nr:hypothetical protein [uncultured bacterium]
MPLLVLRGLGGVESSFFSVASRRTSASASEYVSSFFELVSVMTLNIPEIVKGPNLKIQRAYRHIDEITSRSAPLDTSLYDIVLRDTYTSTIYSEADSVSVTFLPKEPISESFALIIGDTVHNLRSALDHLATEIVRCANVSDAFVHFPFAKKRDDIVTSTGFRSIQEALPNTDIKSFFLDDIQPYEGGNGDDLWAMNKLNNIDKHNFILPAISVTEICGINLCIGSNTMTNLAVAGNANGPINILTFDKAVRDVTISKDFKTSVDIFFGQGGFFGDEPIIPTLLNLTERVAKTVNAVEALLIDASS